MSAANKVVPVAVVPTPPANAKAGASAKIAIDPKLKKAAEEFEAMFVRQILSAAKVAGKDKEDGYDGMAVDAMASAVTKGGGLGLARQIEEAIRRAGHETVKK